MYYRVVVYLKGDLPPIAIVGDNAKNKLEAEGIMKILDDAMQLKIKIQE